MKNSLLIILSLFLFSLSAQVKTDSLVLFYPFNGNAMDQSGNGIHGTVNGAALDDDRFFRSDSAYLFDGINDHITILDTSAIKLNFPFSVSVWVNVQGHSSGHKTIISNCETANAYSGFSIKYWPNGDVYAFLGDGVGTAGPNNRRVETFKPLEVGKWYHIAVSFNGLNDMDFYLNGEKLAVTYAGQGTSFANNGGPGIIGRNATPNGNNYHNGFIDDIRIYNDSLTYRDVRFLYYASECQNLIPVYDTLTIHDTIIVHDSIAVTDTLIITVPLGGPNLTMTDIKVYPNPASDRLFIDFGSNYQLLSNYTVNITNSLGQVVYNQTTSNQVLTIDLTTTMTAKGIYFFNLLDGTGQIVDTRKILIQ